MTICCLTIALLFYINYQVIKIVKLNDIVLVGMLVSLKVSLFWYALFFGYSASVNQGYICNEHTRLCLQGMLSVWPGLTTGIAMTLTFNKWVNYTIILLAVK